MRDERIVPKVKARPPVLSAVGLMLALNGISGAVVAGNDGARRAAEKVDRVKRLSSDISCPRQNENGSTRRVLALRPRREPLPA